MNNSKLMNGNAINEYTFYSIPTSFLAGGATVPGLTVTIIKPRTRVKIKKERLTLT